MSSPVSESIEILGQNSFLETNPGLAAESEPPSPVTKLQNKKNIQREIV